MMMKVVHLSTTVGVNYRLHCALHKQGIDTCILVSGEGSSGGEIIYAGQDRRQKFEKKTIGRILDILLRRWYKLSGKMPFSHGILGTDVSAHPVIRDADVIHLHWICYFQSIETIKKLIALGKPIVWTCHDSWPFTGGCHVRLGCENFTGNCGKCPILHSKGKRDLSWHILKKKKKAWRGNQIYFIAPSRWMQENISKSALFSGNTCRVIANPIDTEIFRPLDYTETESRTGYKKDDEKLHLLFGAHAVDIPYKGLSCLLKALEKLWEEQPELAGQVVLHMIGGSQSEDLILQKYECHHWGFVDDVHKMAAIYNIADIYVLPSLDDNLPTMIMESLSCETPVVAFHTGGITDMLEHKRNGYVAAYGDAKELEEGIIWVHQNNRDNILGKYGRETVKEKYDSDKIARQHIAFYEEVIQASAERN